MVMPEKLGRYRIEAELGQGTMGRVYLAHDPAIDRKVALKTIHLPQGLPAAERAEAEARFHREIQAAGRLSHPHIVTIYDVGHDEGAGTFVAMEYVEGRTLEAAIGDGNLPDPRIIASVGCQAADALAYAHRNGIVHRDIKPANLILVGGRSVKIADFGLAKPAESNLTTDGTLLGTPFYMSPEQIEGRAVDGRSDLFSLAVVVYELLTGKRPFRGDSVSTVVYRILHEPPVEPDLSRLPDSSSIKTFLARALSKDPARRYPDGDAFARALREAMNASEMGVEEDGPPAVEPSPGSVTTGPAEADPKGSEEGRSRPYKPASTRAGKAKILPGDRPDGGPPRAPARGRFAGGTRRSRSAMPIVALLAIMAAVGFVYRDELFEMVAPLVLGESATNHQQSSDSAAPATGGGSLRPVGEALAGDGSEAAITGAGEEPDEENSGTRSQPAAMSDGEKAEPPATDPEIESRGAPQPPLAGDEAGGSGSPPEGGIRLTSQPEGAIFSVEGQSLPAAILPAPVGEERMVVEAVLGCRSGRLEVSAAEAGQVMTIPVENDIVSLRLESTPGKADVSVDGEKQGRTPTSVDLDACSEHQIKVVKAEHKPWIRDLKLVDGRLEASERLDVQLEALPRGTLVAPSAPYRMKMVLAGGRELKAGEKVSLVANTYRLTLSNDDLFYRKQLRVRIKANKSVTPAVEFPGLARFSVLAAPSNVRLEIRTLDRKLDLGAPPITGQEVVAGTYTLFCRFEHNGEEQTRAIELRPGDNPPIRFVAGKP